MRHWLALFIALLVSNSLAFAQTSDSQKWNDLIARAKQEGELVVMGPPAAGFRASLTDAFSKRFGIQLNYIGANSGEIITRVDNETKAGRVSVDVNLGGASGCWALAQKGEVESMTGKLIAPDIADPAVWRLGHPKLTDSGNVTGGPNDFTCGFQTAEWVMTDLFVNTSIVKPSDIISWKDLLKPQYKGKIASYDPRRSGPGGTPVGYLAALFGQQYLTDLYIGQNVRLTADNRQLAEWVARGEFPIGIALVQFAVEAFRQQGLPIERVFPADGQGSVTGGFSVAMLIKNAPHPNAAQVFVNWFGSQEAQTIYEKEMMEDSLRNDVKGTGVPDYIKPKPGVAYPIDDYSWEHQSQIRLPAVAALSKELER